MEQKVIQYQKVFVKEVQGNLKELNKYIGNLPAEVMHEMQSLGMRPTGEQICRYLGSDGKPSTLFTLQVGCPVNPNESNKQLSEYPAFHCVCYSHHAPWSGLGNVYEKIIGAMMIDGYKLSGETREIYHSIDFNNQQNNGTEIQIGIL